MKKNKIYLLVAACSIIIFFIVLHALRRNPKSQPFMPDSPWALQTAKVSLGDVHVFFPALGTVESASDISIAPQVSGTVTALGPRAGGMVKAGELLAQINTNEIKAQRDALKAQLTGAENAAKTTAAEYERKRKLQTEGYVAQSVLDAQETEKQKALATVDSLIKQIKALEIKITYGTITSPVNASVIKRNAEIGDTVFPGNPIYQLSAEKGGRTVVPVPLSTLVHIKPGDHVELINGRDILNAKITRVNPSLDAFAMGNLEIDLAQRPFGLPDKSPISVNVITHSLAQQLVVPSDALVPSADPLQRAVFLIRQNVAGHSLHLVKEPVEVLLCGREGCAIRGELKPGDVVARGHGSVLLQLHDGDTAVTALDGE
jgi:RND family efflux transporter MFP subunit